MPKFADVLFLVAWHLLSEIVMLRALKQIRGHGICHAGAIDVVTSRQLTWIWYCHVLPVLPCKLKTSQDSLTKFLMGLDEITDAERVPTWNVLTVLTDKYGMRLQYPQLPLVSRNAPIGH